MNQEEKKTAKPPASDSDDSEAEYEKVQADAEYFNDDKDQSDDDGLGQELSNQCASAVFGGKRPKGFKPIKDICKINNTDIGKEKQNQVDNHMGTDIEM